MIMDTKKYIAVCKKSKLCFINHAFMSLLMLGGILHFYKVDDGFFAIFVVAAGVFAALTINGIVEYLIAYIACTNTMLVGHTGILFSKTLSMPLNKVQSVKLSSDPIGKILGYYTVTITNAGSGEAEYVFTTMYNAEDFVNIVNDLIH